MSGENQTGFLLSTQPEDNAEHKSNTGSFVLSSPSSGNVRTQSLTLKKTKYDKLLKLYNDVVEKKNKLAERANELQLKKNALAELERAQQSRLAGDSASQQQLEQLRQTYEQTRKLHLLEVSAGEAKLRDALREVMELDSRISDSEKSRMDSNSQIDAVRNEIAQQEQRKAEILLKISAYTAKASEVSATLASQQQEVSRLGNFTPVDSSNQIRQSTELEVEIGQSQTRAIQLRAQIDRKIAKQAERQSAYAEATRKLATKRGELDLLKKRQTALEQQLKEREGGVTKEELATEKARKNLPVLEKKLKESEERVRKAEKEEREKQGNLQKVKEETKEKYVEVPAEFRELKAVNEKLKGEVARLEDSYRAEKEAEHMLVPPHTIQKYIEKIEVAKQHYQENKNLPERVQELEQEIKKLRAEKEAIEWNVSPVLKNIEESQRREVSRIAELEEQIKKLQKESAQVTNKLDEYAKAYPDFEFERKRSKKHLQPAPSKILEKEDPKRKSKSKGPDRSPEPAPEPEPEPAREEPKEEPQPPKEKPQQKKNKIKKK